MVTSYAVAADPGLGAHTVNTGWRQARAEAAAALALALEDTLAHIQNVEDALDTGNGTVGHESDPVVTAGHAYAALLRSKVTELKAEADAVAA